MTIGEAQVEKKTRWDIRPAAEWEAIFKAQEGSHLSAAKYCREQGIDYKQFLYNRNGIRKKETRQLAITVSGAAATIARRRGFTPISVEGICGIRICFPRGFTLESGELPSAAWVAEVALRWNEAEVSPC